MIVKELIEILKQADPNDIVVMSSDGEGNSYSKYVDVTINDFNFCDDAIYYKKLTDEMIKDGYAEEDIRTIEDGAIGCVLLSP